MEREHGAHFGNVNVRGFEPRKSTSPTLAISISKSFSDINLQDTLDPTENLEEAIMDEADAT